MSSFIQSFSWHVQTVPSGAVSVLKPWIDFEVFKIKNPLIAVPGLTWFVCYIQFLEKECHIIKNNFAQPPEPMLLRALMSFSGFLRVNSGWRLLTPSHQHFPDLKPLYDAPILVLWQSRFALSRMCFLLRPTPHYTAFLLTILHA